MKTFLSVLVVLAAVSPLYAATTLLQENFDGTAGNPVAGWNGWTGDSNILISSNLLDQGNSADWAGGAPWPGVSNFVTRPTPSRSVRLRNWDTGPSTSECLTLRYGSPSRRSQPSPST
jgi:hypothetical protein